MTELTHASLFSGIGGIDLAAEAAGFQTCAQVEVNPFVSPSSASDSLTQSSSETSEKSGGGDILKACRGSPTVLSGGFPCQPVSLAGKKLGSKDDRWLWPEYARLIRECKPSWIVAENVASLVSIPEFTGIYNDLETEGYEIRILYLRATDVGAPHVRKRCFIIAHSESERLQTSKAISSRLQSEVTRPPMPRDDAHVQSVNIADTLPFRNTSTDSEADSNRIKTNERSERTRHLIASKIRSDISLSDWKTHPSAFCRMDDGVPSRMDKPRLQALGNAVVPRVAFSIFECIARIERGELR